MLIWSPDWCFLYLCIIVLYRGSASWLLLHLQSNLYFVATQIRVICSHKNRWSLHTKQKSMSHTEELSAYFCFALSDHLSFIVTRKSYLTGLTVYGCFVFCKLTRGMTVSVCLDESCLTLSTCTNRCCSLVWLQCDVTMAML